MAAENYLVETVTTASVAPGERAAYWSGTVDDYQSRLDYRYPDGDDFDGGMVRKRTGAYQLVRFRSDEVAYVRTAGQVRRDPDEDYRLLVPVGGELLVRQDDRQARLTRGTGSLLTLGAPFELVQSGGADAFIMTIPARDVDGPLNASSPVAAALDFGAGLGRVVGDMMTGLFEERGLSGHQFDAVCDRMVELLCMLVVGDDRPDVPGHLDEVEKLVRRYVRGHAADPDLTGAAVAEALGWSLRQVQLALQHVGTTPRDLIREERLRLARERLLNPAYRHLSITEIAHASGFSSASVLSTAFRRRFGASPRELRYG